jgi:hypothetical protein
MLFTPPSSQDAGPAAVSIDATMHWPLSSQNPVLPQTLPPSIWQPTAFVWAGIGWQYPSPSPVIMLTQASHGPLHRLSQQTF